MHIYIYTDTYHHTIDVDITCTWNIFVESRNRWVGSAPKARAQSMDERIIRLARTARLFRDMAEMLRNWSLFYLGIVYDGQSD